MSKIHKTALTPYTAKQMYNLVNDIESYPLFLPGCKKVIILEKQKNEIKANVEIQKGSFNKSFSTLNVSHEPKLIDISLLDGPFDYLKGAWSFEQESAQISRITFDLDFQFKNKLTGLVASPIITPLLSSFVDAFCQRAKEVYGIN